MRVSPAFWCTSSAKNARIPYCAGTTSVPQTASRSTSRLRTGPVDSLRVLGAPCASRRRNIGTAVSAQMPAATTRLVCQPCASATGGRIAAATSPPSGIAVWRRLSARPRRATGKFVSTSRPPAGVADEPATPAASRQSATSDGGRRQDRRGDEHGGDQRAADDHDALAEPVREHARAVGADDLPEAEAGDDEPDDRRRDAQVDLDEAGEDRQPLVDDREARAAPRSRRTAAPTAGVARCASGLHPAGHRLHPRKASIRSQASAAAAAS